MSNSNASAFNAAIIAAAKIEFNPEWANGTGYYNYAVKGEDAPVLAAGEMRATNSGGENNRNILIIGTRFGNVVLFQRYSKGESDVIVGNIPRQITDLFMGSAIGSNLAADTSLLTMLIGNAEHPAICANIGTKIEALFA